MKVTYKNNTPVIPKGYRRLRITERLCLKDLLAWNYETHRDTWDTTTGPGRHVSELGSAVIAIRKVEATKKPAKVETPGAVEWRGAHPVVPAGWYRIDPRQYIHSGDRFVYDFGAQNRSSRWRETDMANDDNIKASTLPSNIYIRRVSNKQKRS